jgi:hypothetical protein
MNRSPNAAEVLRLIAGTLNREIGEDFSRLETVRHNRIIFDKLQCRVRGMPAGFI